MKFLHAADLHLDAQLTGLAEYDGAPVDTIRGATRRAFENLVSLAIDEQVSFVLIAGDLFDGRWTSTNTGLWAAAQLHRLDRARIPVYLLRGNHDALSHVPQRLPWPSNVYEFSADCPRTYLLDDLGVAIHGQSFARPDVPHDLSDGYPDAVPGKFNIGMLHTSLTGDANHACYAPTTGDQLALKRYDYWALGHVHTHRIERRDPAIVFPGCTQGRHINEPGAKGCVLVHVEGGHVQEIEFRPLDVLRWKRLTVNVETDDGTSDVLERIRQQLEQLLDEHDRRFSAVRLELRGPCACHRELCDDGQRSAFLLDVRALANQLEQVWIERVDFRTAAPVDFDQLLQANDLVGELLRDLRNLQDGPDDLIGELQPVFDPVIAKLGSVQKQLDVNLHDPRFIRDCLEEAQGLIVSMLTEQETMA